MKCLACGQSIDDEKVKKGVVKDMLHSASSLTYDILSTHFTDILTNKQIKQLQKSFKITSKIEEELAEK